MPMSADGAGAVYFFDADHVNADCHGAVTNVYFFICDMVLQRNFFVTFHDFLSGRIVLLHFVISGHRVSQCGQLGTRILGGSTFLYIITSSHAIILLRV